jgi:HPt (histidine-containing phosphotransfer) domain-containing protein
VTRASGPSRDADSAGTDVLDHMGRLEARAVPGLTSHVIPIFIRDTEERLVVLRNAVLRQDVNVAHRVAHTVHGSAAAVGALSMVSGCADIIRELRVEAFDRCELIIRGLDADLDSIRRAAQAKGL